MNSKPIFLFHRLWSYISVSIITVISFCEKLTTKEQILRTRQICRICSKFGIVVIVFMIYVYARFHTLIYNWWSVIATKSRSRTVPHDLHLLITYSAKTVHWQMLHTFSRTHRHTSFHDLRLGVSSVIPASRGRVFPCCYYRLWEIKNNGIGVSSSRINFLLNFVKIGHLVHESNREAHIYGQQWSQNSIVFL
jgi:hypothetical protein